MVRFKLPKYTKYVCGNTVQPTYKDYYTTVKNKPTDSNTKIWRTAIKNLRFQLFKATGVWWQYIDIDPSDLEFEVI